MRLHFLGIGGTFMAALACIAREQGHEVEGSDAGLYPPMSTVLEGAGIRVHEGYRPEHLEPAPDLVVVGNAMTRGNPAVEHLLDRGLDYESGPAWLARHVLRGRHVIAVAGTHGKTTVSSLVAWILECAGLEPGWLIGGLAAGLGLPGRLGTGSAFVVEADEYDTAFFDKRSKFVHYRPRTLVINNLEYDHADIFEDLAAIERQFHHVVRTVPANGCIIAGGGASVDRVLATECWTPVVQLAGESAPLAAHALSPDGSHFEVSARGSEVRVEVAWKLAGAHNVHNALAALAAARTAGVGLTQGAAALSDFGGVARRLERAGEVDGITVHDDFAHHPTAIRATLEALRSRVGSARIAAALELRSNTMRRGIHRDTLRASLEAADAVFAADPGTAGWSLRAALGPDARIGSDVESLVEGIARFVRPGDHVLIMSNGSFDDLRGRLLARLEERTRRMPPC